MNLDFGDRRMVAQAIRLLINMESAEAGVLPLGCASCLGRPSLAAGALSEAIVGGTLYGKQLDPLNVVLAGKPS